MDMLRIVPLFLLLAACGGTSSGDNEGSDLDIDIPEVSNQTIDCSPNNDSVFSIPLPEYPGNYSAYSDPVGGGFDPENFVELSRGGLLLGIAKSEEGIIHEGPSWNIIDESLNTEIQYQIQGSDEIWSVVKNGSDSEGHQYINYTDLEIEQTASCGLNIRSYDDNGDLEGDYVSSTYAWTFDSYENGNLTGQIITTINQDRSGKTTSESFVEPKPDYPVTISEWDSNGDNVLIKTCKTKSGVNCQTAMAP